MWNVIYDDNSVINSQLASATALAPEDSDLPQSLVVENDGRNTTLTIEGQGLYKRNLPPTIDYADLNRLEAITAKVDGEYILKDLAADTFFRTTFMEPMPLYEHIYRARMKDIEVTGNNGGPQFSIFTFDPLLANTATSFVKLVIANGGGVSQDLLDIITGSRDLINDFEKRKTAYKNILTAAVALTDFYKNYPQYYYSPTDDFREMMLDNKHRFEALGISVTGEPLTDLQNLANNVNALSGITGSDRAGYFCSSLISSLVPTEDWSLRLLILHSIPEPFI